jgi:hypothetical protein
MERSRAEKRMNDNGHLGEACPTVSEDTAIMEESNSDHAAMAAQYEKLTTTIA